MHLKYIAISISWAKPNLYSLRPHSWRRRFSCPAKIFFGQRAVKKPLLRTNLHNCVSFGDNCYNNSNDPNSTDSPFLPRQSNPLQQAGVPCASAIRRLRILTFIIGIVCFLSEVTKLIKKTVHSSLENLIQWHSCKNAFGTQSIELINVPVMRFTARGKFIILQNCYTVFQCVNILTYALQTYMPNASSIWHVTESLQSADGLECSPFSTGVLK